MAHGASEHPVDPDTANVQAVAFTVAASALQKPSPQFMRLVQAIANNSMPLPGLYAHLGVFLLHMHRDAPGCVSFDEVSADVLYNKRPQRSGNCAVASKRTAAWVQLALNARGNLGAAASVVDVHAAANLVGRALRDLRANRLLSQLKHARLLGFRPELLRDTANRDMIAQRVVSAVGIWRASQLRYDAMRGPALAQLDHALQKHGRLVPKLPSSVLDLVIHENDTAVMKRLLEFDAEPSFWTLWRHGSPRMRQLCG